MKRKNREEITHTFASMNSIALNGRKVTSRNLGEFALHLVKDECNETWDVYTIQKGDEDFFIVKYKDGGQVDWVECLHLM
jgi:hypothetical protein